jgi:glycosyltransferase involved in cell wall biosynthesis
MHIAQIAPLTEAVPPKFYGGTERVIHWLTEELVALGHDVTLYASGDSVTSGRLEAVWPRALRIDGSVRDPNALHMSMLERVRQQASDYDFLHFHLDYYPFSLFSRQPVPFVTTLHGRLDLPEHQPVFKTFSSLPVISISDSQRRPIPQANWARTIYHGLPQQLRPRRASIVRFQSRANAACRFASQQKLTKWTVNISTKKSARCWMVRAPTILGKSATPRNRNF